MSWGVGFGFRPLDVVQRENRRGVNLPPLVGVPVLAVERFTTDAAWTLALTSPGQGAGSDDSRDSCTHRHALVTWSVLGRCWKAALHIKQGERDVGVPMLSASLEALREVRFAFYCTQFMGTLAGGIAATGEVSRGLTMIDQALERCAAKEELWCMAELLRLKGTILVAAGSASLVEAEDHFRQSLDWAHRQGALSWELRAATS